MFRAVWLAGFAFHFLLLTLVSCEDTLRVIASGYSSLPSSVVSWADRIDDRLTQLLRLAPPVTSYLHLAGIESGYSFFAPKISDSYRLTFELHHKDGSVSHESKGDERGETGIRWNTLVDQIGQTEFGELRNVLLRQLAASILREHTDVERIRAIVTAVTLPTPAELRRNERPAIRVVAAYEFPSMPPVR